MPTITLKRFMIFNSNEGHHESQEGDKLLYHWTKEAPNCKVPLTEQIDDVCLCDASVNVSIRLNSTTYDNDNDAGDASYDEAITTIDHVQKSGLTDKSKALTNDTFNPNENFESLVLTFEKTLILIVEIEPKQSIWMAVHVAPPTNILDISNHIDSVSNNSPATLNLQQQINPNLIPVNAIKRVMINIYARFCLLNGNFQMIADEIKRSSTHQDNQIDDKLLRNHIRDKMREVCNNYFDIALPDIHLGSIISNVASLYNYILYLDLNPITLMKVNSFINHIVCINAVKIRHTIVVFNEQLLWSTLNKYDTRLLYNYLVSVLIRDSLQEELCKEVDKVRRIKEDLPVYLTGDDNISINDDIINRGQQATISTNSSSAGCSNSYNDNDIPPKTVNNKQIKKLNKFYFTVFRSSNNMTLGLIFSEQNLTELIEKCEQILTSDSRLGVIPMASLAQSVGQNFLKANSQASHHHHNNQPNQSSQQHHSRHLHQSSANSTTSGGSNSKSAVNSRGRITSSNLRSALQFEQKYIYMDKLDSSITWPLSVDMMNKEQLLLSDLDSFGLEIQPTSKKLRLIKYLIELEPELIDIIDQTGSFVEEFFAKTISDTWLTITNSRYRTVYSIHNNRNYGLPEIQHSANTLKSILAGNTFN